MERVRWIGGWELGRTEAPSHWRHRVGSRPWNWAAAELVTDRGTTWWVMLLLGALHWRMRPFIVISHHLMLALRLRCTKEIIVFDLHNRSPCMQSLDRKLCHSALCRLANSYYLKWIINYFLMIYCFKVYVEKKLNLSKNITCLYFAPHRVKQVLSVNLSATNNCYIYEWNVKDLKQWVIFLSSTLTYSTKTDTFLYQIQSWEIRIHFLFTSRDLFVSDCICSILNVTLTGIK